MNAFKKVKWNPDRRDRRRFALTLLGGLPASAVAWFLIVRWFSGVWKPAVPGLILAIGCPMALLLFWVPALARPFYILWHSLVGVIDFTVTLVILTLIYVLVLTPVGLLMRLAGRQFFPRHVKVNSSYWREAQQGAKARDYLRQF